MGQLLSPCSREEDPEARRERFRAVAKENEELCRSWQLPVPATVSVTPAQCSRAPAVQRSNPALTFGSWSTADAALYFGQGGRQVCAMNFANGQGPGGGYVRGASAQEEDLCRRIPTLYPSLCKAKAAGLYPWGPPTYVKPAGGKPGEPRKYADVLFTKDLYVVRAGQEDEFEILPDDEQAKVSLVSAAAPNIPAGEVIEPGLLHTAIKSVFIAPKMLQPELDTLILGAWGCGAFRGNPTSMSELFVKVLKEDQLGQLYREIHFAIPTYSDDDCNAEVFLDTFERCQMPLRDVQA